MRASGDSAGPGSLHVDVSSGASSGQWTPKALLERIGFGGRRPKRSSVLPVLSGGQPDVALAAPVLPDDSATSAEVSDARMAHRGSIPRAPPSGDSLMLRKKAGKIEDFVPEIVTRYLLAASEAGRTVTPPAYDHFPSVAMFADLSGFTVLSETLAVKGGLGAESLGFWLNRYFELLVKLVAKSGGDVFKFAGDAFIALWPPEGRDATPDGPWTPSRHQKSTDTASVCPWRCVSPPPAPTFAHARGFPYSRRRQQIRC